MDIETRNFLMALDYLNGMTQSDVCKKYHCSNKTLTKVLKVRGGRILTKSERNKVVKNNPLLEKTDEGFYWLGYFIADGNISKEGNAIQITSKDLNHLIKYHNYCKNPGKIHIKKDTGCGISKFSSALVKKELESIGITSKKSFTVDLLIPFNWSIVRGLFDGDGSISKRTVYIITGSTKLRNKIEEFFKTENILYTIQQHTNCWKIVIRSKSLVDFANKMYNNSSVHLERKYERFRPILEQSNNDNRMNSGEVQEDNPEPSCVE